ncbi:MAG: Gfo/Idh/MocA family oxidoreductase [Nitrolancea sp.]
MTTDPFGIGVVGCGTMGKEHATAVANTPSVCLVAVSDRDASRATSFARQFDVKADSSIDALLSRDDVGGVIIATPTPDHVDSARRCAAAGKHILLEKPAALSLDDLASVEHACDDAGVTLMIGQTMRFDEVVKTAHDTCREGAIGTPVYVNWVSNTARRWPGGWRGWQTDTLLSGGMALHLAIHNIDLALWLLDDIPVQVYAQGNNIAAPGLDVNDFMQVGIRCRNGSTALLESQSTLAESGSSYVGLRLIGTEGQIQWSSNEDGAYVGQAGPRSSFAAASKRLEREIAHFAELCLGQVEPQVTRQQTWNALAVAVAATESIDTGRAISLINVRDGSDGR